MNNLIEKKASIGEAKKVVNNKIEKQHYYRRINLSVKDDFKF